MAAEVIQHDPDTTLQCCLLIAHPVRPHILALREARYWALPALTPLEHHPAAVGHINDAVHRQFGLRTFVRRLVSELETSSPYPLIRRLYEMEVISELPRQRIERTVWADRSVLLEMDFEDETDRKAIETWISEYESRETESTDYSGRPPWSRAGWFEIASAWMRRHMTGSNQSEKVMPHQHWTDDEMTVLSAESGSGFVVMIATKTDTEPDAEIVASLFGWDLSGLITKDTARHWYLYEANDRAVVGSVDLTG